MHGTRETTPLLVEAMPGIFVVLWATGFIGTKLGIPYAEPFTFLTLRFILALAVLALIVLAFGAPRPTTRGAVWSGIAGMLIHGLYLGGVFWSIRRGMPAGLTAVIVGIQPLLTTAFAGFVLTERITVRQWAGLVLGLVGVVLVILPKLDFAAVGVTPMTVGACLIALLGITAGTLVQRVQGGGVPLWSGTLCQYAGALFVTAPLALALEDGAIEWNGPFAFALGWLVLVLSIGAISLLVLMLRRGALARTAALFYLVPPVAALFAFVLFGETLGPAQIGGMALAAIGVRIAARAPA